MNLLHVLNAHPANCLCIEFDPTGKYFAVKKVSSVKTTNLTHTNDLHFFQVGSADALVSLWDINEVSCQY